MKTAYQVMMATVPTRIAAAEKFVSALKAAGVKGELTFPVNNPDAISLTFEIGPYTGWVFMYPKGTPHVHWCSEEEIYTSTFHYEVGAKLGGRQPTPAKKLKGRQVSVAHSTLEEMIWRTLKGIENLKKEILINARLVA